jgi:hypothetical protein
MSVEAGIGPPFDVIASEARHGGTTTRKAYAFKPRLIGGRSTFIPNEHGIVTESRR